MELWDIYNKERELTGDTIKRDEPLKEGEYHLVVHISIINQKHQMLIQQRQPFKKGWPNCWDITVGGSVVAGENSWQGAQRELEEEIGYRMDMSSLRPSFTVSFHNGFDDHYIIERDIDLKKLKLQEEEVQDAKWASKDEIFKMIDEGTFISYRKELIELIFSMKNSWGCMDESI